MRSDSKSNGTTTSDERSIPIEVQPETTRRTFSAEEKQRILRELEGCRRGEAGAIYRREGIYASTVADWRRQQKKALSPRKRGPKPEPDAALRRENQRLQQQVDQLQGKLRQAEMIMEIQKKVSEVLGITLPENEYRALKE
jgi:transposase